MVIARRDELRRLLDADRFIELQKQVPVEISSLPDMCSPYTSYCLQCLVEDLVEAWLFWKVATHLAL